MNTKKVIFFADLYPGWDGAYSPYLTTCPSSTVQDGFTRFRIEIELPLLAETVVAKVEPLKS